MRRVTRVFQLADADVRWYAPRVAVAVSLTVAAVLAGVVAYRTSHDQRSIHEVIAAPIGETPVASVASVPKPQKAPVRFANPFDRAEVFEFPSDTTEADARAAVAELLLARARERQVQYQHVAAVRRPFGTAR